MPEATAQAEDPHGMLNAAVDDLVDVGYLDPAVRAMLTSIDLAYGRG